MPISTKMVGAAAGSATFTVTTRHLLAYAAALDDDNPAYLDDAQAGGIVGPPLFGVRLDWPLRPIPGAITADMTSDEARRGVHATQEMIFHRLVRPGDRLTTTGVVASVEQRPPGAYVVTRYDTVDDGGGAVLTVHYGSIFRGLSVDGTAATEQPPLPRPVNAAHADRAAARWSAEVLIARTLPHIYTECADIWNPIHTERAVALAAGLPDIILHGTATLALAARELVNREAGGDPTRLARIACRFGAMVVPGAPIRVVAHADRPDDGGRAVSFSVENAEGGPAIRDGVAIFR